MKGGDCMVIGFAGAGKVGVSLGKYFCSNGIKLSGYYSRTYLSAEQASKFTNSKAYADIESFINDSKIIFLTTPDDSLSNIWNIMSKFDLRGKLVCHTSGSLSSKIFSDICDLGAYGYSVHPIFAFSDKFSCYKKLNTACFSIEGDTDYIFELKSLIESLGNKVFIIETDKKPLYHLACVTVSNLVLSLINFGCSYLTECGIADEDALSSLIPLIENNIDNLKSSGFLSSLTGPVERSDSGTVKRHMEVIPEEHRELYRVLSLNLLNLSVKKHCERDYTEIRDYLRSV